MNRGYDKIVWCYDTLSYIVFGNAIRKAQTQMLDFIPAKSTILIAGGGTGWILEAISAIHSTGLHISYIDLSKKMIEKSKKRNTRLNEVHFTCTNIEDFNACVEYYDVIITPFFFDNFQQSRCESIFRQLQVSLKKGGIWMYADFTDKSNPANWQKYLLKVMYLFFRLFCNIEAKQLPAMHKYFIGSGFIIIAEKVYYKDFIVSRVYRKLTNTDINRGE